MAYTYTATQTIARTSLIEWQIITAFRHVIPTISEDILSSLRKGIRNQWIKNFDFYGIDKNNLCRAQIKVQIDWQEHRFQMKIGNDSIEIGGQWRNNLAIEIDEVVRLFEDIATEQGLWTKWTVRYEDWIYDNPSKLSEVRSELGFSPSEKIKWGGQRTGTSLRIKELSEMKVGFYMWE